MTSPSPADVVLWSGTADPSVWDAVTRLYVEAFAAPPYGEEPGQLGEIAVWGPAFLATPGAALVTGTQDGDTLGFALGRTLASDPGWQRLLGRCSTAEATALTGDPHDVFVIQELATAAAARRRGIARLCLARLLGARPESRVVLGVYEQAVQAHRFYAALGYTAVGAVTIEGGQRLDVLAR
ncbi:MULTISPECIES: GNAT family N-acetyltransferase [Microbacterium]|uniref:GNAT family N-acetyltransferase n=1 Tax=Microbacterium TaxID=33882 RepID=UPI0013A5A987|nr:GNAT family N-acetyltransferase [Microbacterium sp. KCTC 39802]